MREMALGIAGPADVWSVWKKEAGVALINGAALGLLLGGIAYLWQQNIFLSLVVGAALAINTVVAVSIGGIVPLALKGLKLDPALASGPILTTVTDMCGFFLTLSLATLWLSRIAG
jgi:magnesium transporter